MGYPNRKEPDSEAYITTEDAVERHARKVLRENWHLDKKIPITLILTIVLQTGGFVWWAATKSAEIKALEDRTAKIENLTDKQSAILVDFTSRMARIEERLATQTDILSDIRDELRGTRGRNK